jgi:hypothetical protein
MIALHWVQSSSASWYCIHGKYFLKKKQIGGSELYEIWQGEQLKESGLTYFKFLKMVSTYYKAA